MGTLEIKYDKYGRMLYNPEFHSKMGKTWTREDEDYLVEWYFKISAEEMSFALDRTEKSVCQKASVLKKQGRLKGYRTNHFARLSAIKKTAEAAKI